MVVGSKKEVFPAEYRISEHKIMCMEVQKRQKVIETALREFGKGYREANTDTIAKDSGISKGLVFHYFGSKRKLYLFLFHYSLDKIMGRYDEVLISGGDFLDNIRTVSKAAIHMMNEYPLEYGFMIKAAYEWKQVFPDGLPATVPHNSGGLIEHIMEHSDDSLFLRDIEKEKLKKIALWTMQGFSEELKSYYGHNRMEEDDYERIMRELEEYLEILRNLLYIR